MISDEHATFIKLNLRRIFRIIVTMTEKNDITGTGHSSDNQAPKPPVKRKRWKKLILPGVLLLIGLWVYWFFYYKSNFREVVDGTVYRSAQPRIEQLAGWVKKYDIRTVLNLRGDAGEITDQEIALTEQLGIDFRTVTLSAYLVPTPDQLVALADAIENAQTPLLLHCRQGMDRSGLASMMAAMAIGGQSYSQAKWQAWMPPGPWKRKPHTDYAHISDVLEIYEDYCDSRELDCDHWQQFEHWIRNVYAADPNRVSPGENSSINSLPILTPCVANLAR